jgi:hypothetical protein
MPYAELPYAEEMDGVVLTTLCREPGPWALDELTRVLGPGVDVEDAVNRLRRSPLPRSPPYVFAEIRLCARYPWSRSSEIPTDQVAPV